MSVMCKWCSEPATYWTDTDRHSGVPLCEGHGYSVRMGRWSRLVESIESKGALSPDMASLLRATRPVRGE